MKKQMFAVVLFSAVLPTVVLAAPVMEKNAAGQVVEVEHYEYNMPLDVEQVISVTRTPSVPGCGVSNSDMQYEDSKGQVHTLEYLTMGTGCNNG